MKMLVRFASMLMAVILTTGALASCGKNSLRPHDPLPPIQALFLHVGYMYGTTNAKYVSYSDEDIQKLTDIGVTEVCIAYGTPVAAYTPEGAAEPQMIVTAEDVNNMSPELVGPDKTESDITEIKSVYSERAKQLDDGLTLEAYADFALELMERLIAINPEIKIWYSFPDIAIHPLSQMYIEPFLQYYEMMKSRTGEEIWNNNIQGFYWLCEGITTEPYDNFDTENLVDFDNEMVKAMKACADVVHDDGKLTFWCPYYRQNTSISMPIGFIANQTDIFDYVILQPNHVFYTGLEGNIEIIKESTLQNSVLNQNMMAYGGEKRSSTMIGPEMEMEASDFNGSNSEDILSRYQDYVDAYGDMLGEYPMAFYCGARPSLMDEKIIGLLADFLSKNAE